MNLRALPREAALALLFCVGYLLMYVEPFRLLGIQQVGFAGSLLIGSLVCRYLDWNRPKSRTLRKLTAGMNDVFATYLNLMVIGLEAYVTFGIISTAISGSAY